MNAVNATIFNEDCIANMVRRLGKESVDLCVTSIPFSDLFTYSGKIDDVGNCSDGVDSRDSQFGLTMRFFINELWQVLRPGCNADIHIQQLIAFFNKHGYMGKRDFKGAVIDLFSAGGFNFIGETAIPKNPQRVAQQLHLHSLQFATGYRDSRKLAPTTNDYVLMFQKPGEGEPVRAIYDRVKNPGGWVSTEEWIKWASGVWGDILEIDTIENWGNAREKDDEKHVCPIQLEVVRRCVMLHSSPGGVVLDPFMGIGSTAWTALGAPSSVTKLAVPAPRNVVGFELKDSYHALAERNARKAIELLRESQPNAAPDLFTLAGVAL